MECATCGYVADSVEPIPEPWAAFLADVHGRPGSTDSTVRLPLCLGCQQERDRYLNDRYLEGGRDVDEAVREFLAGIDSEQLRVDSSGDTTRAVSTERTATQSAPTE